MAVHTALTTSEIELLLRDYSLGDLREATPILAGIENTNYQLHTTRGQYVLTLFERRTNRADLPYFMSVLRYFANAGLPVAAAIANSSGDVISELKSKAAIIVPWLSGRSQMQPTPKDCAALGTSLGRMHKLAIACPYQRAPDLSFDKWQQMAARFAASTPDTSDSSVIDWIKLSAKTAKDLHNRWPDAATAKRLPQGAVHCDLFPDNVLMDGHSVSGIIDFYFCCSDWLIYDLAVTLNAWSFHAHNGKTVFMAENFKEMLSAYQAVRPLEPAEVKLLPVMLEGSALRFLLTRLEDWLQHLKGHENTHLQPKNPQEFADILAFHQAHKDIIT